MSSYSLDFAGVADSTLLTALGWLGSGSVLEVSAEAVHANNANDFTFNYAPTSPSTADQAVRCTVGGSSGNTIPGVALRMSADGQNCYFAYYDGQWIVGKRVAGTLSLNLGTSSVGAPAGGTRDCVFAVEGDELTLEVDGVEVISVTDSDISAAGEWGLFCYYADASPDRYLDDLVYVDIAAVGFAVDTIAASIVPDAESVLTVSTVATTPTVGNTTVSIVDDNTVDAAINSITDNSDGTYDITFTFDHDAMPPAKYGTQSLDVSVAAESVQSGDFSFSTPANYSAVTLTNVDSPDFDSVLLSLAVGNAIEHQILSGNATLSVDANATATVNVTTPANEQFSVRAWDSADNTWGAWAVYVAVNDEADPATVAPTITPTAGTTLALDVGDSYADPAWTWADDVISGQAVSWSGDTVNTAVAGVYTRTASATNNIDTTTTNLVITVNAVAVPGAPQITSQSVVSLDESAGNNFDLFTLMATGDGAISWNISGGASAADYTINIGFNGDVFFELRRKTSADFDTAPQEFVQVTATGDVSPAAVQLITININEVVVPATIAPTITPTAGTSIELTVGDSYSDPAGWTWADDVVSDQPVNWGVGDVVDAGSVGVYIRLPSATNNIGTTTQAYTVNVIAAVQSEGVESMKALLSILPATITGHYPASYWQGNTHVFQIKGLQKEVSGDVIADANMELTLSVAGVDLPGVSWPLEISAVSGSPGDYKVAVAGDISVTEGSLVDVLVTAVAVDGSRAQWESQLMVRDRKFL